MKKRGTFMSKVRFSKEQIERLKDHPCIEQISEKAITYTDDFKERAVKAWETGLTSRIIFEKEGLSSQDLGNKRITGALNRWRKMSQREDGFKDTRSTNTRGRARARPRTPAEEIEYLRDKVEYLEQENEFLKKLKALERKVSFASRSKTNIKSSIK
jgi:transposase-like protein